MNSKSGGIVCIIVFSSVVSACSESQTSSRQAGQVQFAPPSEVLENPVIAQGDITHVGTVSIADELSIVSDLLGNFYKLDTGISSDYLIDLVSGQSSVCHVREDDTISVNQLSVAYLPDVPGVAKTPISVGETIVFTSPLGTFATLTEQPAAGFLFYDIPFGEMLAGATIPEGLTLSIGAGAEFPSVQGAVIPEVTPLIGFSYAGTDVLPTTAFSWEAAQRSNSIVRISTATVGGFFLEQGVHVDCLVQDNGSFAFPAGIREQMGADFRGMSPTVSRISANIIQQGRAQLLILRESIVR